MAVSDTWRDLAAALIGPLEFTAPEVAQAAGVDLEQGRRLWRALGLAPVPDDQRAFSAADVAMLRAARTLAEQNGTAPEVFLQLARVTGQSLARVADAQVAARAANATADRLSEVVPAEAVIQLVPSFEPVLSYAWRRHLLAALMRLAAEGAPSATGRTLAVGFADLVGFTAISQQLDERELAAAVDRFEALAYEQILERGGRVVKMIGDEVMFAVDDVHVAGEIALALVDVYAKDSALPDVRIGLANGPTLSWEGDLFGPTVNLASRLVNIARPGTVLVSEELGAQLTTDVAFTLRHLRPLNLKGIGRVRAWVLRRAHDERTGSSV
jgi:adenylate cyclase